MGGFTTGRLEALQYGPDGQTCDVTIDGRRFKVYRTKKDGSVKDWFDGMGDLPEGTVSYATSDDGRYLNFVGLPKNGNGNKPAGRNPQRAGRVGGGGVSAPTITPAPAPQKSSYEDGVTLGNMMNVAGQYVRANPQATPEQAANWVGQVRKLLELALVAEKAEKEMEEAPQSE